MVKHMIKKEYSTDYIKKIFALIEKSEKEMGKNVL